MKITFIEFLDHPVLGTLKLDFCDDQTSDPFHTVVIAGENGAGKTTVLNEIFRLFSDNFQQISFNVDLGILLDDTDIRELRPITLGSPLLPRFVLHVRRAGPNRSNRLSVSRYVTERSIGTPKEIAEVFEAAPKLKAYFSESSVSFEAEQITAVGALGLDPATKSTRSGKDIARQIAQLIVDIRAADNEDLSTWVQDHAGIAPPSDVQNKRMRRFTRAIEFMWPTKRMPEYRD